MTLTCYQLRDCDHTVLVLGRNVNVPSTPAIEPLDMTCVEKIGFDVMQSESLTVSIHFGAVTQDTSLVPAVCVASPPPSVF